MLRFLVVVAAIIVCTISYAQDCASYVSVVTDQTGEKTPAAKKNIVVADEQKKGFDITALAAQNTVVLVVGVTGGFPCVGTGDLLEVSFTDQSTLTMANAYNANCDGRSAVYLGPAQRNLGILTQLSAKSIASLKVWTKAASTTISFNEKQAADFSNTLKCLSSYLNTENYKGDSIPNYQKPVYQHDTTRVMMVVEVQPEYEGGYTAMMEFIRKNLRYPIEAIRAGKTGTVYVSFVIDEKGVVHDPKVLRPLFPELDAEALRVVALMPKWKPGMQQGIPVKVRFNLPIKFNMEMKSESRKKGK